MDFLKELKSQRNTRVEKLYFTNLIPKNTIIILRQGFRSNFSQFIIKPLPGV